MLERVGLTGAEGRLVRQYSLGMRQRLGIGAALLGDPAALVLDEPANGLDPEGIRWMRILLQDFASRGGTVLLSSHLLREVEATADRLVVIGGGRIVAQGTLDELLGGAGRLRPRPGRRRAGGGPDHGRPRRSAPARDGGWKVVGSTEAVGRAAAASGLVLTELRESGTDGLEELFFTLTTQHRHRKRAGSMSTVTFEPPRPPSYRRREPVIAAIDFGPRQSFLRLVRIELRKMVDTRSGRWLLIGIVALSVAGLTWGLTHLDPGPVAFTRRARPRPWSRST